ncbi:F-box/WD repeat-containing protein 5 [Mactra antiquata]
MPTMSTKPGLDVGMEEEEICSFPCWRTLPDHFLLHIFSYLDASSLAKVGLVCKGWLRVAFDELLWKDLFYRHWRISRKIPMAPGKYSWIQEYKRLLYHTPSVESEVLKQHADQVLHVSFSHNGKMFATCSKDGFIRVWDATYPTSLKYKADMRKFTWKYTQFSQFNSTDTLLLVSGVHFGSLSTSGEIAVFSLEGEFVMQSRVMNKPYDVFGTWYNDFYLLSGNLYWTGHLNSCSAIWLNKAYQETSSEEESVVMRLFKFSNINASSIRTIMIANCLNSEAERGSTESKSNTEDISSAESASVATPSLIGDSTSNQEEVDMLEDQEEPNNQNETKDTENETKKPRKPSKSLQSIQVFENGEFITKFLEVDTDEPNNKRNGTIEYSNAYRLAEEPEVMGKKGICGDTSGSDFSNNGNHSGSDMSSMNGSSDVMDQNHSFDMDYGIKYHHPDTEETKGDQVFVINLGSHQTVHEPVQSGSRYYQNLECNRRHSNINNSQRINRINNNDQCSGLDASKVHFSLYDAPLASEEQFDMLDTNCGTSQVSDDRQSAEIDTIKDINITDQCSVSEGNRGSPSSSSPKRNHGQTSSQKLTTGDIDPNYLIGAASGSSDSLELPEKTPRLAFCCVDYKKQKRVLQTGNGSGNSVSGTCFSSQPRSSIETLGRRMDVSNQQTVSEASVHNKKDSSSRTLQSRMCLGRPSVETVVSQPGHDDVHEKPSMSSCMIVENQSTSSIGIDCVPGHSHTRICNKTVESMDYQSSDSESKVNCKPVRNTCAIHSDTQSVSLSDSGSQSNVRSGEVTVPKVRYKGKTKRSRKRSGSKKVKDKYLIFTKGSETYTPHQIGIKRIKPFHAFSEDGSRLLPNVTNPARNTDTSDDTYDDVDHLIDMHGHIIGMTLSPDHRYLYVNSRPWPKNYFIENPLYPPPIAQEIDIHVIDLLNMREVGTMHRAHKAYTSNDECFFIFLDVCEEYVASGAEDKHGYLWDRHYGLCLHEYPHSDVVNSVAFNPADPEVLVTVSDDFSIKIWRSLSREKEVVKAFNKEHSIRIKHVQALMSESSEFDEKV